jgi:hypothetical protein
LSKGRCGVWNFQMIISFDPFFIKIWGSLRKKSSRFGQRVQGCRSDWANHCLASLWALIQNLHFGGNELK